jgi:beta-alanine degradation protein BauB
MIHDLENMGETELVFTTVEFLDSENAPLALPQNMQDAPSRIEGRATLP